MSLLCHYLQGCSFCILKTMCLKITFCWPAPTSPSSNFKHTLLSVISWACCERHFFKVPLLSNRSHSRCPGLHLTRRCRPTSFSSLSVSWARASPQVRSCETQTSEVIFCCYIATAVAKIQVCWMNRLVTGSNSFSAARAQKFPFSISLITPDKTFFFFFLLWIYT